MRRRLILCGSFIRQVTLGVLGKRGMSEQFSMIDASDSALTVAARGDRVLVFMPGGGMVEMSLVDARRSMQRLADAIALAEGRSPLLPGA